MCTKICNRHGIYLNIQMGNASFRNQIKIRFVSDAVNETKRLLGVKITSFFENNLWLFLNCFSFLSCFGCFIYFVLLLGIFTRPLICLTFVLFLSYSLCSLMNITILTGRLSFTLIISTQSRILFLDTCLLCTELAP